MFVHGLVAGLIATIRDTKLCDPKSLWVTRKEQITHKFSSL